LLPQFQIVVSSTIRLEPDRRIQPTLLAVVQRQVIAMGPGDGLRDAQAA